MISQRFRGFFPVVIDVETGGFNAQTDALLEVAAYTLELNGTGELFLNESFHEHVEPFEGANIEAAALEVTGIVVDSPLRGARPEKDVISKLFSFIRQRQKQSQCQRSILVGHNPTFDLGFIQAAVERNNIKRNPLHPFSTFDTATLAGMFLGQTVLAKACNAAGVEFHTTEAHSALYDTKKTAELFCAMANRYRALGGWPLNQND